MRDLEHWKDKVELSLDGRQIFFLFFGTAVAICLVFVVGVLTGKRIEARALALTPAPVEDPLAALDQLGDEDFTYAKTLTAHEVTTHEAAHESKKAEPAHAAPPKSEPARPLPQLAKTEPAMSLPKLPVSEPKSEPVKEAKTESTAPKTETAGKLPSKLPAVARAALPALRPQVAAAERRPNGHFTLQLSAFPDRGDADAFMHKIQAAGYHPFMVASEIPGKGLFYRVRVGDYGSRQAALAAKAEFEHKQRMIAYVARL